MLPVGCGPSEAPSLASSVIFFYIVMIPDIAMLRDLYPHAPAWRRQLYRVLSLGW